MDKKKSCIDNIERFINHYDYNKIDKLKDKVIYHADKLNKKDKFNDMLIFNVYDCQTVMFLIREFEKNN